MGRGFQDIEVRDTGQIMNKVALEKLRREGETYRQMDQVKVFLSLPVKARRLRCLLGPQGRGTSSLSTELEKEEEGVS